MPRVTLRLPENLHRRLRASSERAGASLNQLIVAAPSGSLTRGQVADCAESSPLKQLQQVCSDTASLNSSSRTISGMQRVETFLGALGAP